MTDTQLKANRVLAAAVAACALIIFQFFGNTARGYIDTASLFYWWGWQWFNPGSECQHGPLILILSGWVFWKNLKEAPPGNRPALGLGLLLLAGALGLHFLGCLTQQTRISIFSFLVCLAGCAFLLGGRRWGKAAVFPCMLMLFSIPLGFLNDEAGFHLRLQVIKFSTAAASALGFDVARSGTQLFAPGGGYSYDVAPACSGIRSLTALTALTLLLGYISFRAFWRRALIFLLAFPFAFAGNVLRILTIIMAAEWFGQEAGQTVHEWFGLLIFIIVLGLAMGVISLMDRLCPEQKPAEPPEGTAAPAGNFLLTARQAWAAAAAAAGCSILTILLIQKAAAATKDWQCGVRLDANATGPAPLPKVLNYNWLGKEVEISPAERQILPEDTGFSRKVYTSLSGRQVLLSVILSGRDRSSIHRPELCLTGQGWTIQSRYRRELRLSDPSQGSVPATVLRLEKQLTDKAGKTIQVPALFVYWFVSGDGPVASHMERMWKMAVDRIFFLKNHRWAYISLQTDAIEGQDAAMKRIEDVASLALPRSGKPQ